MSATGDAHLSKTAAFRAIEDTVRSTHGRPGPAYWIGLGIAGSVAAFGGWSYSLIVRGGLHWTGLERPLDMQLNPDVTVRSRGVMEKCTFCIQRIRYAENQARDEGRPVRDGEIVPACAQTCPAQAIVFGDAKDPASHVSRLAGDRRAFRALEDLGTGPAITYLARAREGGET